jgi:hypothetical protein
LSKQITLLEMTQALSDLKYYIDVQPAPRIAVRKTKVQELAGYERASGLLVTAKALIATKGPDGLKCPNLMLVR